MLSRTNITLSAELLSFDELAAWVDEMRLNRMQPTGISVSMQAKLLPPEMREVPTDTPPAIVEAVKAAEKAVEEKMDEAVSTISFDELNKLCADTAKRIGSRMPIRDELLRRGGARLQEVPVAQWDELAETLRGMGE